MGSTALKLFVISENKRFVTTGFRLPEFQTSDSRNLVLAESVGVVQLATGSPKVSAGMSSLKKSTGFGSHINELVALCIHFGVRILDCACGVTLLCRMLLDVLRVDFIYELGLSRKSGDNLKEKIAMVAHFLTARLCLVIPKLVNEVESEIFHAFLKVHVFIAAVP